MALTIALLIIIGSMAIGFIFALFLKGAFKSDTSILKDENELMKEQIRNNKLHQMLQGGPISTEEYMQNVSPNTPKENEEDRKPVGYKS